MCRCTCRIYSKKRKCWVKDITCLKSTLLLRHTTCTHTHTLPTASPPRAATAYSPSTIQSKGTFPLSLTKQTSLKFWISANLIKVLICISLIMRHNTFSSASCFLRTVCSYPFASWVGGFFSINFCAHFVYQRD